MDDISFPLPAQLGSECRWLVCVCSSSFTLSSETSAMIVSRSNHPLQPLAGYLHAAAHLLPGSTEWASLWARMSSGCCCVSDVCFLRLLIYLHHTSARFR